MKERPYQVPGDPGVLQAELAETQKELAKAQERLAKFERDEAARRPGVERSRRTLLGLGLAFLGCVALSGLSCYMGGGAREFAIHAPWVVALFLFIGAGIWAIVRHTS